MESWPKDDAERTAWCLSQGILADQHCCLDMAFAVSNPRLTPHAGPNRIVDWNAAWDEYRIPMPYDGYASTLIRFCPWCGERLPASRREEWFRILHSMGFDDPSGQDDIPVAFESAQWWRSL